MSDDLLIEAKEIGNHRISIYYDSWNECPITNWDMAARYLFEYNDCYYIANKQLCGFFLTLLTEH